MKPLSNENKFLQLLRQYSPIGQDYAQLLLDIEKRVTNSDFIVPILGTQGMGKSTMMNAVLGEDILPSEADETTCVPVEVRYGSESYGEVHFADGRSAELVRTKSDLSEYVDNNYNPGNCKEVTHIVLYRDYPLLKTGMVIVDLPGVGSLTKANEDTTNRYIQQLCVAIFIISTSPPILKTEAYFIQTVWRNFNTAYFVQNVWDDNTQADIAEGLLHNSKILDGISRRINAPLLHPIIPVNAYAAAKGVFEKDEKLINESNISELLSVLAEFAADYHKQSAEALSARIEQFKAAAIDQIDSRIKKAEMTNEELLAAMTQEENKFTEVSAEIEMKIGRLKRQLSVDKKSVRKFADDIAQKYTEILRTEIFHLIDQGIVDGSHLSTAFGDYQTQYATEAMDEVYEEFSRLQENLKKYIEELGEILERENLSSPDAKVFNKAEAFKWEKGMDATVRVGSAIGGTVAMFAIGGPAGVVAGLAIGIVGSFLGGASRRGVLNARGKETKDQVTPYILTFQSDIERVINDSYERFCNRTMARLTEYRKAREEQLQHIQESITALRECGKRADMETGTLIQDKEFLTIWRMDND